MHSLPKVKQRHSSNVFLTDRSRETWRPEVAREGYDSGTRSLTCLRLKYSGFNIEFWNDLVEGKNQSAQSLKKAEGWENARGLEGAESCVCKRPPSPEREIYTAYPVGSRDVKSGQSSSSHRMTLRKTKRVKYTYSDIEID